MSKKKNGLETYVKSLNPNELLQLTTILQIFKPILEYIISKPEPVRNKFTVEHLPTCEQLLEGCESDDEEITRENVEIALEFFVFAVKPGRAEKIMEIFNYIAA